jgi:hypothetical protein
MKTILSRIKGLFVGDALGPTIVVVGSALLVIVLLTFYTDW